MNEFLQAATAAAARMTPQPDQGGHFGPYGGRYVPEVLMAPIEELETAYLAAREDPAFQAELADLLHNYAGRPTPLYFAKRLSENTGRRAHLAQARRPAAHRRAQDQQLPGAGAAGAAHGQAPHHRRDRRGAARRGHRHGLRAAWASSAWSTWARRTCAGSGSTSSACACWAPKWCGVTSGSRTLKDAISEAMRDWVTNVGDTHYLLGSALGSHPYPMMVRDFHKVIGEEARRQILEAEGRLPDTIFACVGGGSQRHRHLPRLPAGRPRVQLVGIEAGGRGDGIGEHAARYRGGAPGVLQGAYSYRAAGRRRPDRADAFRLGGPGLRHDRAGARLAARPAAAPNTPPHPTAKRSTRRACSRAPKASFRRSNRRTPWPKPSSARPPPKGKIFLVNVSGRGDKDIDIYRENLKELDQAMTRIGRLFEDLKRDGRKGLIAYLTAGDPSPDRTPALVEALVRGGADLIELGVPFSDPIADGPVIQRAGERALKAGTTLTARAGIAREIRRTSEVPLLLFTYLNPVMRYGLERLAQDAAAGGIDGCLLTDASVEEAHEYVGAMHRHGLDTVFLAAPTSTERRLKLVAQYSTGFVYLVSRTGVTGERESLSDARGAAGARRARGHRSAAGGRLRHLQAGARGRTGRAGGSGGGGQRHRAADRAQQRQRVARNSARILHPRIEARLRSARMTPGRSARTSWKSSAC